VGRVVRFSVSIEPELLDGLDDWLEEEGFSSRSQGVREIVRERLKAEAFARGDEEAVATVSLVYDHHKRDLMERLAHLQHEHLAEIVSSVHVHLTHHHCLEVLILRGRASAVGELAKRLVATKGVLSGEVSLAAAGGELTAPESGHAHPHAHGPGLVHSHPHDPAHHGARPPRKRARKR